ncbi:MAG: hypothetical protein HYV24_12645 [Deltaproteobacteria bacterium]|nr:hypothetical protein [Deltaproteobacteria bacterium]
MGRTDLVVLLAVVFMALLFGSSLADTGIKESISETGEYSAKAVENKEEPLKTKPRNDSMSWSEVEDSYSENAENWSRNRLLRESKDIKSEK